jgi:YD repeat-containing protein
MDAPQSSTALWDAYRRTTYAVQTGDGEIRIHPGRRSPELDRLLDQRHVDQWAYVTAYNPASRLLSEPDNIRRQQALVDAVRDRGLTFFEGASVLDAVAWPPEPSLLILGIPLDDARALGREFGQLAIVAGRLGEPACLVACEDEKNES